MIKKLITVLILISTVLVFDSCAEVAQNFVLNRGGERDGLIVAEPVIAREKVVFEKGAAELGDALCISGVQDKTPIVYRCNENSSLRFFGFYQGADLEGNHFAITEGITVANVLNKGFPIKAGELLTTSSYEGGLMRQKNNITQHYTVAKVTADVQFEDNGEHAIMQQVPVEIIRTYQLQDKK